MHVWLARPKRREKKKHFTIHFDIVQRFIAVKFSSSSDSRFVVIVSIPIDFACV